MPSICSYRIRCQQNLDNTTVVGWRWVFNNTNVSTVTLLGVLWQKSFCKDPQGKNNTQPIHRHNYLWVDSYHANTNKPLPSTPPSTDLICNEDNRMQSKCSFLENTTVFWNSEILSNPDFSFEDLASPYSTREQFNSWSLTSSRTGGTAPPMSQWRFQKVLYEKQKQTPTPPPVFGLCCYLYVT